MADPDSREMQLEQHRREQAERERADDATDSHEALTHARRAERAAFLKDKLDERARSEDEADG